MYHILQFVYKFDLISIYHNNYIDKKRNYYNEKEINFFQTCNNLNRK